jgi:alpha-tubulin suppressor-like RCC1 family protein
MELLTRVSIVVAIAATGCVFEDRCVGGAVRDEGTGRCVLGSTDDAGADGGMGFDAGMEVDAGPGEDGGLDAGMDGGMDAGPAIIEDFIVAAAHACAVSSEGELRCWGANQIGALATGDVGPEPGPVTIDLGAPVVRVAGNTLHVCAETTEPALYCWGGNEHGQVGNGMMSTAPVTTPYRIPGLGASRDIYGSFANMCFAGLLGGVVCWGRNDEGQLGIGTVSAMNQTSPGDPVVRDTGSGNFENASQLAVADRHVCIVTDDGRLFCVGNNGAGELGAGDTMSRSTPIAVPGMEDVTSVSAAASHTCAVNAGTVYCWGANDTGEVDPTDATPGDIITPTAVAGVGAATQVATASGFSCALLMTGQVTCWGSRENGGIGDGMPVSEEITGPTMVTGLSGVVRLEASYITLICALTDANELYCWGTDAVAILGGVPAGSETVFLDGETRHTAPVRVDPFAM